MRTLALTILTMGIVLAAGNARAQTYDPAFPFCMQVVYPRGANFQDCTYYTMAQCAASASGRGLQCSPNPYYAGPTASVRRNDRRYRKSDQYRPQLLGPYRIGTACKGAKWAIPAIACSPATPNAWPPRAELTTFRDQSPVFVTHQRNGTYRGRY